MIEITKAKVLEVFMRHFTRQEGEDQQRAFGAYNLAVDELSPWKEDRSPEEKAVHERIVDLLIEILQEDYGITMKMGKKFTARETEGCSAGGGAAVEWLKTNAAKIPPFPDDQDGLRNWFKTVNGWAFELVPAGMAADKEWTYGFIAAFTGDLRRHLLGQTPIGPDYKFREE